MDFGSTCTYFARELARSTHRGIRIATHSLSVALELLDSPAVERCTVFGGELHHREAALFPTGRIRDWNPFGGSEYLAVMTSEAISLRGGAGESRQEIVRQCRLYMSDAQEIVMLVDHSKFMDSRRFTMTRCGLEPEDTWLKKPIPFKLITDTLWENEESPEFKGFVEHPRLTVVEGSGEFSDIVVFESKLIPA